MHNILNRFALCYFRQLNCCIMVTGGKILPKKCPNTFIYYDQELVTQIQSDARYMIMLKRAFARCSSALQWLWWLHIACDFYWSTLN